MGDTILARRLKAFKELTSGSHSVEDVMSSLISDGALSKDVAHHVSVSYDPAETLFKFIEMAHNSGKIQLLTYNWQLLPTKSICITIVSPHKKREFTFEEM